MKIIYIPLIIILLTLHTVPAAQQEESLLPSYFRLTTSNGLIVAVYDTKSNAVEYVFPHIFANYDSALFVKPFIGNIRLIRPDKPIRTGYQKNTHIITAVYDSFTVNFFTSFTRDDKVFYTVIRGAKRIIENISLKFEAGNGKVLTGISLLTNSHDDLTVYLGGKLLRGETVRKYDDEVYEKYFLFSFTDSLHADTSAVISAAEHINNSNESLLDQELRYMLDVFAKCSIPEKIKEKERNVAEQSISFLKMAQVSDREIFPYSHGQVLASLRPGLWHVSWVRDGSFAISAMTHLGLFKEAKKALEFMLKAPSGYYKHYIHKDGRDYGVGSDYQISVCRYFGTGKEESTYGDGPNIEFDNFGLFLWAFSDYVDVSSDTAFLNLWKNKVITMIADVTVNCIDSNSLIRADSGPWEHYLQMPKQYTFTSGVCAKGLEEFAGIMKKYKLPHEKYEEAASGLKKGILTHMLSENNYIKGNSFNKIETEYEYYDAGVYEIFANGLINDKKLFLSHMHEYDKVLRLKGSRPGYIRLNSADPYENQEWVFINLRIALAHLLFGQRKQAELLLNYVTEQASINFNTIPEMYSNKVQSEKVTDYFKSHDVWCNCIRDKDGLYIGAIPMVGYGAGAYILTLLKYYSE